MYLRNTIPIKLQWHCLDPLVQTEAILVEEGRISEQHLIHADAHGPPVHALVISIAFQHFRGEVLSSTTLCHRHLIRSQSRGQTEIYNLNVAILVKEDVL